MTTKLIVSGVIKCVYLIKLQRVWISFYRKLAWNHPEWVGRMKSTCCYVDLAAAAAAAAADDDDDADNGDVDDSRLVDVALKSWQGMLAASPVQLWLWVCHSVMMPCCHDDVLVVTQCWSRVLATSPVDWHMTWLTTAATNRHALSISEAETSFLSHCSWPSTRQVIFTARRVTHKRDICYDSSVCLSVRYTCIYTLAQASRGLSSRAGLPC